MLEKLGIVREEDYFKLIQEIDATGNKYDINISILHIDENPSKKIGSEVVDDTKIGENIYYAEYTTQIEEALEKALDGKIKLKEGDYIKIDVENVNETMYQTIQKSLYGISNGSIGRISGSHTSLVVESTDGKFVKIVEEGK